VNYSPENPHASAHMYMHDIWGTYKNTKWDKTIDCTKVEFLPDSVTSNVLVIAQADQCYVGRRRYFLRVTMVRRLSDLIKEQEILVHALSHYPEMNNSIKMEVGIEDCLHIEFEYNKSKSVDRVVYVTQ